MLLQALHKAACMVIICTCAFTWCESCDCLQELHFLLYNKRKEGTGHQRVMHSHKCSQVQRLCWPQPSQLSVGPSSPHEHWNDRHKTRACCPAEGAAYLVSHRVKLQYKHCSLADSLDSAYKPRSAIWLQSCISSCLLGHCRALAEQALPLPPLPGQNPRRRHPYEP